MNILTDRCKLEFDDFCTENSIDQTQLQLHKSWYFASVCDYFESLNIIITLSNVCDDWWYQIKCPNFKSLRPDRYSDSKTKYQALENAIIKANDFRNSKLLKKEVGLMSGETMQGDMTSENLKRFSERWEIHVDDKLEL